MGIRFFPLELSLVCEICVICGLISPVNFTSRGTVPAADCEEAGGFALFETLESDCRAANFKPQSRLNITVPHNMDLSCMLQLPINPRMSLRPPCFSSLNTEVTEKLCALRVEA